MQRDRGRAMAPVGASFHSEGLGLLSLREEFTNKQSMMDSDFGNRRLFDHLWIELCSMRNISFLIQVKNYTEVYPFVPQKVTLFRNMVFTEIIKLK